MNSLTMTLCGTRPLLQHNVRLSDPLDPAAQELAELTGKRKKTLADHEAIADIEFRGGIYHDDVVGPYVKTEAVEACFKKAGALQRGFGVKVQRGVLILGPDDGPVLPLLYRGPRDVVALSKDPNYRLRASVKVGQARVMRTRPRFPDWKVECKVVFDETQLSESQLISIAHDAGRFIGLGDHRPRYGCFGVEVS